VTTGSETRTIRVGALARVEGEGGLKVRVRNGRVVDATLRIYEPPRFFEALLRGRMFWEAPDITSRICGICPIAYILSASQAMESALGVAIPPPVQALRRLIYCGEWIESHVLHAAFLHAPDFLGLDDAFRLARSAPELVRDALALKKLGNRIIEVVGGRAIHPVNLKVGGFYRAPRQEAIQDLIEPLETGMETALRLTRAFARFDFPDIEVDYAFVSLAENDRYAIESGRIVDNQGLDCAVDGFEARFREQQVRHSTALQGLAGEGEAYLVGPLARYANNFKHLSPMARELAAEVGLGAVCRNPFRSILVRMIEVVYACEQALQIVRGYEEPAPAAAEVMPGAGSGHGATEAPRGLCYHRYRLDDAGRIVEATIVPPTAQNQTQIEADLRWVVEQGLHLDDARLTARCEQAIRNHDPCISCATHFLTVVVERV
jgi:coenzyme F420-reducing hydrogenase alpha subunit